MILPAMLGFDGDVHQLGMIAQPITIIIRRFRLVRHNRNDGREFANAYLPHVKISYHRIAIAFYSTSYRVWQIGRCRCAIEQDATGIANQCIRPGHDNSAAEDAHSRIEPSPAEKFSGS